MLNAEAEVEAELGIDVAHPIGCTSTLPHDWHIYVTSPCFLSPEYDSEIEVSSPPAECPAVGNEGDESPSPSPRGRVSYSEDVDHPLDVFMSIRRMCLSEDPETI